MAVQISENGRLFTLHTKNSSYQMYADPFGTLLHLYYGKRTDGENLSDLILRTDMGFCRESAPGRIRPDLFPGLPAPGASLQRGGRLPG